MKSRLILTMLFFFFLSIPSNNSVAQTEPFIEVTGLVNLPYNITMSELKTLPMITERVTCTCVGWPPEIPGLNSYVVYTFDWTGVPVSMLLERAGLKAGAVDVIFYASDGYTSSIDLEHLDQEKIISVSASGAPLDRNQGGPFRLVVPGWWGYKWVKFVERIKVVDYDYKGTWESSGYPDIAIIEQQPDRGDISRFSLPLALIGIAAISIGIYMTYMNKRA